MKPAARGLSLFSISVLLGLVDCEREVSYPPGTEWGTPPLPAYTGQPRKELTLEQAAAVLRVLEAFPGSQVISFEKHTNPERLERPPRRS